MSYMNQIEKLCDGADAVICKSNYLMSFRAQGELYIGSIGYVRLLNKRERSDNCVLIGAFDNVPKMSLPSDRSLFRLGDCEPFSNLYLRVLSTVEFERSQPHNGTYQQFFEHCGRRLIERGSERHAGGRWGASSGWKVEIEEPEKVRDFFRSLLTTAEKYEKVHKENIVKA